MNQDRIAALEQRLDTVATIQARHNKEMAENLTMVLGIGTSHQREIKQIHHRLGSIEQRLGAIEGRMTGIEGRMTEMNEHIVGIDTKLDAIIAMLSKQTP